MANVGFHAEAFEEYQNALEYYANRSLRAAQGFEQAISETLTRIGTTPEFYPLHDDRHREAILLKYPYAVLYRIEDNGDITVVAIAHGSRAPGYWKGRA